MEQQEAITKQIRDLYKENPDLVNDDREVELIILERLGLKLDRSQRRIFKSITPVQNITRACRTVRAEHDYELGKQVVEPVQEGRFAKFKMFRRREV